MGVVAIGETYGRLVVEERGPSYRAPSGPRGSRWWCRCECGVRKLVRAAHLRSGLTRSCGCRKRRDDVGSRAVHQRLDREQGPAREHACVDCGRQAAHWSFDEPTGFSTDQSRYAPRCASCHTRHDLAAKVVA